MKLEIHLLMMWTSNIKLPVCTFFFLLFFSTFSVFSSNVPVKEIRYDSSPVTLRKIPAQEIDKLHKDADYSYTRHTASLPKTAWERFKDWFWNKLSDLFDSKSGGTVIQIIKYLLVATAILLVIFLLMKNDIRTLFYKKSAYISPDFMESIEDIHEMDFDKRIADEVANRDFKKAIRLYFLKIIKELNQQNLISWKLDKTNTDYLKELRNGSYYSQFAELSRLYEYVWYGDFKLDEAGFLAVIQKFNQFKIKQTH